MTLLITERDPHHDIAQRLEAQGLSPLMARLYAARGITHTTEIDQTLHDLIHFTLLKDIQRAASLLAQAITCQERILIIADYDCDGATACAVAVRGLRLFHANVDYLIPNRFKTGYGLSPEIVELAAKRQPDWIITVDNGIASVEGVKKARQLGIKTIITDHHLPGEILPNADAIINPNQTLCPFPSKHLAGVGVIFYVLLALRKELAHHQAWTTQPRLDKLLSLVALGTVADMVKLDQNNRILVAHGLARIRKEHTYAGISALFALTKRTIQQASCSDLGFYIAPRLNAAGRLEDMSLGVECLITDDPQRAWQLAHQLEQINQSRKQLEKQIHQQAIAELTESIEIDQQTDYSISLFQENWHQGIIGIVAGRIKEKYHRPTFIFAPHDANWIKGSGRSIPGFHLKDALDLLSKHHPYLLIQFGGHAMAAGVTIERDQFPLFKHSFEQIAAQALDANLLTQQITTDGSLVNIPIDITLAEKINQCIWGQGFPVPIFSDTFIVREQTILQEKHSKLILELQQRQYPAIWFNQTQRLPAQIHAAYQLNVNIYQGKKNLQLLIAHANHLTNRLTSNALT